MALAAPATYRSSLRESRRREDTPWRLPLHHVADICDVARGVEETNAGVCTKYLVDQLASSGRADIDDDGYINHLEAIERFCDRYNVWRHPVVANWRMRVSRCRRALARMRAIGAHDDVAVLYVAHGYPDPILIDVLPQLCELVGERWPNAPLSSLARYTDPVEGRREEMVRREAVARPGDPPSLVRVREREAWADALITSSDALRAGLAPFGEEMPAQGFAEPRHLYENRIAQRTLRRKAHDARRVAFALDLKLAATRLLQHAEQQYHAAWLSVPR